MVKEMPRIGTTLCSKCGREFPIALAGLGMNIGSGPEYLCEICAPAADTATGINVIEYFLGGLVLQKE